MYSRYFNLTAPTEVAKGTFIYTIFLKGRIFLSFSSFLPFSFLSTASFLRNSSSVDFFNCTTSPQSIFFLSWDKKKENWQIFPRYLYPNVKCLPYTTFTRSLCLVLFAIKAKIARTETLLRITEKNSL